MTTGERQHLLDLRNGIEKALLQAKHQRVVYPVDASDAEYRSLINKAVFYRRLLKRIHVKIKLGT